MMNRLSKLFVILLLFVPSMMLAQFYTYSKRNGQVYYDGKVHILSVIWVTVMVKTEIMFTDTELYWSM